MNPSFHHRLQWAYSGVLTVVLALVLFTGWTPQPRAAVFDEIDVERINIREPDGTLRMVLASRDRFPGLILRGVEYPHPNRSTAGMLFFNDDGSEQGGLIFGGSVGEDGDIDNWGHLSFDRFEQDQVITLNTSQSGESVRAGMSIYDRPSWSMVEVAELLERTADMTDAERGDSISAFFDSRESSEPRMYLGRSHDGSVSLRLNDARGRERLIVEVTPEGAPVLRMLDEEGNEVARFPD